MSKGIRRFMMYVTDEVYDSIELAAKKQSMSVQRFVRETIEESLGIKSNILTFHNDGLCPQCLSDGALVEDYDGNTSCLNCGFKR